MSSVLFAFFFFLDFTEENKAPAEYLVDGAQALAVSLKSWTQRKDVSVFRHPAPLQLKLY